MIGVGETGPEEVAILRRERDLYWQLLSLGLSDDPEVFLDGTLSLFIEVVRARRGYIEIRDPSPNGEGRFSLARGLDSQAVSPGGFSRTIISEAFSTGETVVTASAQSDPRFSDRGSVRAQRLEAVLCAPIGRSPVLGVIYLQDCLAGGPFSTEDRRRVETFARHASAFADRLLVRRRNELETDPTLSFRQKMRLPFVGASEALAAVFRQVAAVASLQIGVLLTGPCGTGKTQLARAIHDNGPRAGKAFVELNCAALPADLIESELFGAAAGGHSTAHRAVPGKIEAAEGGTLFLDEVGELPARAQAVLLQLLQSGTYFPLGGTAVRRANIRVIAATNADLALAVSERRFREDLFFRLNVFPIRAPALSERPTDIPLLAEYFCRQICEANGLPAIELSAGAVQALKHAEWPGNVRELAHTVEAAVIRAHSEGLIQVERQHLFPASDAVGGIEDEDRPASFHEATRRFQETLVRDALKRKGWNVTATARSLDLTRAHLYNLMATFRIGRPEPEKKD